MRRVGGTVHPQPGELEVESSVRARLYGEPRDIRAIPVRRGKPEALAGRYRLLERIGSGGMADVYRAHDRRLHRDVAAKVVAPWLAHDPAAVRRLSREAGLCARLAHPHVAGVLDVGDRPRPFVVMELVEGRDLAALLEEQPLTTARALDVLLQLCDALAHAHGRGVLHCDVAPRNVLIAQAHDQVKLVDFGLAVDLASAGSQAELMGTPGYVAPERTRGAAASPAADLYSLGVVAYRLLGGPPPWRGAARDETAALATASVKLPSLAHVRPDLPRSVTETIDAAMASRPADRPPSVAQFRERLLATSRDAPQLRAA